MPVVRFAGCSPVPLLSYLKALGVLRVLAGQADPDIAGAWDGDSFVTESSLDSEAVERFFLDDYQPTPILGPWAGGSGFFPKDRRVAVDNLAASNKPRVEAIRETIAVVRRVLADEGVVEKPKDEQKLRLLRRLRADLPDEALLWLDAAFVLGDDKAWAAPLLGSGGNDGRFDFGRNYLERLDELGFATGDVRSNTRLLREALWGVPASGLKRYAVGQFDPGGAGGPNATTGMEGESLLNPWDWVFAMEGAVLFAGASSRRYQSAGESGRASFPFSVQAVPVGDGVPTESEQGKARGELWLPLWTRLATLPGVQQLLAEGRLALGRRQAQDGVESARAVVTLGVQRGVTEFVRVGLYERYGRNYLATVMGRFPVRPNEALRLLDWGATGRWLQRYLRVAGAAPRHASAARRLEGAILDLARYGGASRVAALLGALGACERTLARSGVPGRISADRECPPLPALDAAWLHHADDGSPEFRLARALASIGVGTDMPLRSNLEPMVVGRDGAQVGWVVGPAPAVVRATRPCPLLTGILERRLLSGGLAALEAGAFVSLDDVLAFVARRVDGERLTDLLWGLACVRPGGGYAGEHPAETSTPVPREYAVLRLALVPALVRGARGVGAEGHQTTPSPEPHEAGEDPRGVPLGPAAPGTGTALRVLSLLRAGDVDRAVREAGRRLRVNGLPVLPGRDSAGRQRMARFVPGQDPQRLAAALLLPLGVRDLERLQRLVCPLTVGGHTEALAGTGPAEQSVVG